MGMRFRFRDLSLRRKLTFLMLAIVAIVLIASSLALAITQIVQMREDAYKQLTALAGLVGLNSDAALAFQDPLAAEQTLATLRVKPDIVAAFLFDADNRLFAEYHAGTDREFRTYHPDNDLSAEDATFSSWRQVLESDFWALKPIQLTLPVYLDNNIIAKITLIDNLTTQKQALFGYYRQIAYIFCASLLLGLVLSRSFQRIVSKPIYRLISEINSISAEKNYSLRASKSSHDEIGILIDRFNQMLDQVESAKEKLEASNQTLEQRVHERTGELELMRNEALDLAASAQQASETKSQFLANMSHEIRTPMNSVLGMTELLLESELTAQQNGLASTVYRSGERLLTIINEILDYSKIEAGKLALDINDFSLVTTIEDTAETLSDAARKKDLELLCRISPDLCLIVRGDTARITQILLNLIGNAIKFTEHGEVVVSASTKIIDNKTALLRVEVSDTGIGIKPEHHDKLFHVFTQADGKTTRQYGGTGLGLAISKELVELMAGEIGFDSEPGRGSTFWFELPLPVVEWAEHAWDKNNPLKERSVLVVDDNTSSRELLAEQLRIWQISVCTAENGAEAFRHIDRYSTNADAFDFVLIDMHMPDIAGLELAQRIKARGFGNLPRMLTLESIYEPETENQRLDAGVVGHISKPIRRGYLYAALLAALTGKQADAPAFNVSREEIQTSSTLRQYTARILVTEDQAVNQLLAEKMLQRYGCTTVTANNGQEAVDAVRHDDFDLIFMDCQMPVLDGYEATQQIIQLEKFAGRAPTPIVALTANASNEDRKKCLAVGMSDFLAKPFRRRQIGETLQKWLRNHVVHSDEDRQEAAMLQGNPGGSPPVRNSNGFSYRQPPLDEETIKNIKSMGDWAFLANLKQHYERSFEQNLATVYAAFERHDAEKIRSTAHGMKSTSGNLGAFTLAELCNELEKMGEAHELEKSSEVIEQIKSEHYRVSEALEKVFAKA